MIGGVTRFGGSARDARALVAHLGKPQDGGSVYVAGPTTAAPDMAGLVAEARFLAAARGVQDRPFLHIHLAPSSTLDEAALVRAAEIVLREIGVTDQCWGLEIHGKARRSGAGELHAHIVVGRAGASGSLLRSGFEKIRIETAVRVAEYELGDTHVRGRHYTTSLRYLEKTGRQDVAQSMRAALDDRKAPRSSLTPERRQSLERRGFDAVEIRAAVRSAWERSDGISSLESSLREHGLALKRGDKTGVFVVVADDGTEIGALDRLAGARRREVTVRLRGWKPDAVRSPDSEQDPLAHDENRPSELGASEKSVGSADAPDRNRRQPEGPRRRRRGKPGQSSPGPAGAACADERGPGSTPGADREGLGAAGRSRGGRRAAIAALTISRAVYVGREQLVALKKRALALLGQDFAPSPAQMPEPLIPVMDPASPSSLEAAESFISNAENVLNNSPLTKSRF